MISSQALSEEKVPEEIKLATLLKDELRKNAIEAKDATVSLSGKDLIIRSFEMPILPRQELENAVNFEVKKYIPFKTEDLISDFQWQIDKTIQKTRVLFVGIKKETLDKYLSVLKQLGLKVNLIEYSAFSVLRLLNLAGIKEKGIIAVVSLDPSRDDETNFVVLENRFPLFSRDITLASGHEEAEQTSEDQTSMILGKLRREIHISLDYYDRKFPGKSIGKIFFVVNPNYRTDFEGFVKESGLGVHSLDINKYIGKSIPFSLAFVKGYSSSLSKIDTGLKINLLLAKERALKKISLERKPEVPLTAFLRANAILITSCFFLCTAIFLFGIYRMLPLQKDIKNVINMRPAVLTVSPDLNYNDLVTINSNYKTKIQSMDKIVKNRSYLTPVLDALPRVIPEGMWLVNLSFNEQEEKTEFILEGVASLGDSNKELELTNMLVSSLKGNPVFTQYFKEISLVSTERKQTEKISITNFKILCLGTIKANP
jgi:type IV pilus assembly protein PilM